jgi:hypothetical protein
MKKAAFNVPLLGVFGEQWGVFWVLECVLIIFGNLYPGFILSYLVAVIFTLWGSRQSAGRFGKLEIK